MMDRVKETIFNILGESVSGANVLDLFAGSGSLGIEALSRGANRATFVEQGPWALKSLGQNLEQLDLTNRATVVRQDVFRALRTLERKRDTFSIIFLDPPYNQGLVKKILNRLGHSAIVTPLTQLILHRSRQEKLPETLESLELFREKPIGQACLSFLSMKR
jgi:16S rRNA (guanine(966)-N(2))-methyltransferase RsmD